MKKYSIFISLVFVSILFLSFLSSAQTNEIDFNNSASASSTNANLVVQVLKYNPYPVNAGDWFDLWVKIQNIGQNDANNVKITLDPTYPFSSNDSLSRNYGLIYGTSGSYKVDQTLDSSQLIVKYRVKVADNAPEGDSTISLSIDPGTGISSSYSLPITIAKTKTDFDVVAQDTTSQGMSFAIANIGDNDATAVTVSVPQQESVRTTGSNAMILGNLLKGDYTTVSFQLVPVRNRNATGQPTQNTFQQQNVTLKIDYTDSAGIRSTVEKTVPLSMSGTFNSTSFGRTRTSTSTSSSAPSYLYIIIGIVVGIVVGIIGSIIYLRVKRKK